MVARLGAAATGFDPDQPDLLVVHEPGEQAGGVRPAADTRPVEPSLGLQDLGAGLVADPLELADHERVGRGPTTEPMA